MFLWKDKWSYYPTLKMNQINSTYEHKLQSALYNISKRGLCFDTSKLDMLRKKVADEISSLEDRLSNSLGARITVGKKKDTEINIRAPKQLLEFLKKKGFKVPRIPPTKAEKILGKTEYKESVGELALRKLFSETGIEAVADILRVRELETMRSRYIEAVYIDNIFYSNYDVCGTLTGRRGSKKIIFGWGGNGQNLPKHSELGKAYRSCIKPRSGGIFFQVDQVSAEDWPTAALSGNNAALDELRNRVDRHRKLASYIFGKPEDLINEYPERFLGKKGRHGNNYRLGAETFSNALIQEGTFLSTATCQLILEKVNNYDPSIRAVYHPYITQQINRDRFLRTPLGRERYFIGFRPNSSNANLYCEAFAYIPQSTVGDNTGLAILELERDSFIVSESHDSILQEITPKLQDLEIAFDKATRAFDREITFHNGFKINIPIEAEIGFDLGHLKKVKSRDNLKEVLQQLEEEDNAKAAIPLG